MYLSCIDEDTVRNIIRSLRTHIAAVHAQQQACSQHVSCLYINKSCASRRTSLITCTREYSHRRYIVATTTSTTTCFCRLGTQAVCSSRALCCQCARVVYFYLRASCKYATREISAAQRMQHKCARRQIDGTKTHRHTLTRTRTDTASHDQKSECVRSVVFSTSAAFVRVGSE